MKTHTGQKSYQCVKCVANFRDQEELDKHTKNIHAGHLGAKSAQQVHPVKQTPSQNELKTAEKIFPCTVHTYPEPLSLA